MAGETLLQHIATTAIVSIATGAAITLLIGVLGWLQGKSRVAAKSGAESKPMPLTEPAAKPF